MRLRAHQKLFLSYALLVAAVVVALSLGVEATLRGPLLDGAVDELRRELALGREIVDSRGGEDPDALARYLGAVTGHRVSIIAPDGSVTGDSGVGTEALGSLENHANRPEVVEALTSGFGSAVRRSTTVDVELLYGALVTEGGAVLRFAVGIEEIDRAVGAVRAQVLQVGAVALLLSAALAFLFSLVVTRPLRRIRDLAASMGGEELAARLRGSGTDEFGELGTALDALSAELGRRLAQLEGERAEMNALIDAMAEGVLALGPDGILRRANPAARRIFGLGPTPEGLAPEEIARRKGFLELVERALAGEAVPPTELTQDEKHLVATAQPLPRGGAVLVFLDTSELRRLEGVRRDFVANASHELKTPLTVIRGHAETLLDEDLPDALRRQFGDSLRANVDRLQAILDDLLDLSRIESGGWKIVPEPLLLEDLIHESWMGFAGAAAEQAVGFVRSIDPRADRAEADPEALLQIFSNLFSNALRYTPPGGSITVATSPAEEGWVRIEVRDTGSGIPAQHLGRIFERFYRVDPARSRSDGGTGLGLSIVRHLVERHGGKVGAESQVGVGTTVHFTLPRGRPLGSTQP